MIHIETERLILRDYEWDDYEALFSIFGDSEVMRHYPCAFDESRVRKWIEKNIERYRIFGFGLWAIVLKENGKVIGDCGVTMEEINGTISPQLGTHINKDYWRQGYAKEAAKTCIDWTFKNTPFNIIYSYMPKSNIASYSTAISIGMIFEEEYKNNENISTKICSICRDKWNK